MPELLSPQSVHWLSRLLRLWGWFALLTFGVMLLHSSDDPLLFGRYSVLVVAVQAGLLLFALLLWGGGLWLGRGRDRADVILQQVDRWRAQRWFASTVLVGAGILLFIMWLFFLGNHLPTYGFLRAFIGLTIIVAALALLWGGMSVTIWSRRMASLPWVGVGLLLALALLTTPYYPNLMKTDEAFVFSMARNALETGHFRPLIYIQTYPENYYGGIWTWMMAGWMGIAGVSLESSRLYNLILACISLAALWVAASRLYDRMTAWYAVLVGAYAFMSLNHIRFDIHTALWLALGIFFYSLSKPERWWAYLLAGFVTGLGVDSNPVAYSFLLGMLAFFAWEYLQVIRREKRWLWPPFWWVVMGVGGSLVLYLVIHAGTSFADGETSGGMLAFYANFVRDSLLAGHFFRQIHQYLYVFLTNQPVLSLLMFLGIITALWERTRADRFVLALYFAWMAVIILAYFYFPVYYLVLGLPVFLLLAARALTRAIPLLLGTTAPVIANAATLLLFVWLLASVVYDLRALPAQSVEDVVETGRHIAEIVPHDSVIVAAEPYYFGMLDFTRFTAGAIESTVIQRLGLPPYEVWPFIAPDAVVFSEGWPTEPERSPYLMSYMNEHQFVPLACYQTTSFGRVELWTKTIPPGVTPSDECQLVCNPRTGC